MSEQPQEPGRRIPTRARRQRVDTVEAVVRRQLATALGGRRGMVEAAVPTLLFTLTWLTQRELTLALMVSVGAALVLLAVRLVQRSTPQFVLNALFGIGIGWVFVRIAASRGGDEDAQALAYFLPGILYNGVYGVVFAFTCLIGWPVVGFMVGSVTGDPTAWHQDKQCRQAVHPPDLAARAAVRAARGRAGTDLAGRARGQHRGRHGGRAPRRAEDRAGLADAAGRARRHGVGAGAQPHADRAGSRGDRLVRPGRHVADESDGVALGVGEERHPLVGPGRAERVVLVLEDHVRLRLTTVTPRSAQRSIVRRTSSTRR